MNWRWLAAFGTVVIVLAALALAAGERFWSPVGYRARVAPTGQALLDAFPCRYAETKRVVMLGREDGFSSSGDEPSNLHPRLAAIFQPGNAVRVTSFDDSRPDGYVFGYFEPPANLASGLFVISTRPNADDRTDTLFIGDLLAVLDPPAKRQSSIFYRSPRDLASAPGWRVAGPIAWARFEDIMLTTGTSAPVGPGSAIDLMAYVRAGEGRRVVDVAVSDDTSVDFVAMAWCEAPTSQGGHTMAIRRIETSGIGAFVAVWGGYDKQTRAGSNPFIGDTPCTDRRPLLCFRHTGLAVPEAVAASDVAGDQRGQARHWSEGRFRATAEVRGDAFRTIAGADQFCAAQLGPGWRTADVHQGGHGNAITGEGDADMDGKRAWVDVKDQPYANCWSRAGVRP